MVSEARVVTQQPGETPAAACRRLGWGPGTWLVGDEGYGPAVIRVTALGEQLVLAVRHGDPHARESLWTLDQRDWQVCGRPTEAAGAGAPEASTDRSSDSREET